MLNKLSAQELAEKLKAKLEDLSHDPQNAFLKNDIRNFLYYASTRGRESRTWAVDFAIAAGQMGIELQEVDKITQFKE